MIDFRTETFLSVCGNMSYTKAAAELNITQPAVSQHISYLEENYGAKLFEYKSRTLRLTEAGEELYRAALTMRHDEGKLREKIKNLKTGSKSLIFGATRTIGDFDLPPKLARYLKNNPGTRVKVRLDNTKRLLEMLDTGEIDFALIEGYFAKSDYGYRAYSSEPFAADAAPGVCPEECALEALLDKTLIVREDGSGSRRILERFLTERNSATSDFKNVVEINSIHAIKSLAAAGCGLTFLYKSAAAAELKSGKLVEVKINDMNLKHDYSFVWRKDSIYEDEYLEIMSEITT